MKRKEYQKVLDKVKEIVWKRLGKETSGHDYWHVYRVAQTATKIGKKEKADLQVLELAAWLHDAAKGDKKHELRSAELAEKLLNDLGVEKILVRQITDCIRKHRFSTNLKVKTKEEKIIQDADKLDAMGAMGITRVFAGAGRYKETIHDPNLKPDFTYYLKHGRSTSSVNHFYDKLLKLKDLMHTKTAKKIARDREKFMKDYLKQFYLEWEGKR